MMNSGNTMRVSSVSCHWSQNMAASVVVSTITLLTMLPNVLVTAVWAPTTSLFSRDVIDPVGVRVKNAIGIRWILAKSVRRRS